MEPGEVTLSAPAETDDRLGGFAALYRDRYVPMVRLSVLLVDRVELAEEVVQDAFAVVFRRWDELDSPGGYLRREVVNRSRDLLRRRRLERGRERVAPPSWDAPDEMSDAVARLPERQRVAVVLRFYEDLTVDQIAEVMDARAGTVKSWLHRALARLGEEMAR
jgi:RNA polymerase sigma factor (sigma-70 family)